MSHQREIKKRNIFMVYAFFILTFGIYGLVWSVKSKRDMNALGAEIPTSWLLVVPVVGLYWAYKYCEGISHIKKDNNALMWFAVSIFAGFVLPFVVQSELNEIADQQSAAPTKPVRNIQKRAA